MRRRTVSGKQGDFSQPVFAVTTGLTTAEITGIVVATCVAGCIVLGTLLHCLRRTWVNWHQKENIAVPEISQGCGQVKCVQMNSVPQGTEAIDTHTSHRSDNCIEDPPTTSDERCKQTVNEVYSYTTDNLQSSESHEDRMHSAPGSQVTLSASRNEYSWSVCVSDSDMEASVVDPYITAGMDERVDKDEGVDKI